MDEGAETEFAPEGGSEARGLQQCQGFSYDGRGAVAVEFDRVLTDRAIGRPKDGGEDFVDRISARRVHEQAVDEGRAGAATRAAGLEKRVAASSTAPGPALRMTARADSPATVARAAIGRLVSK